MQQEALRPSPAPYTCGLDTITRSGMVALAQRMRVSIDEPDDNEVQFLSLVVTARAYDATLAATNMDAIRVMAVLSVRGALGARAP